MTGNWYDDRRNLALLLSYMADDGFDTSELIRAVEKPWSYVHEFNKAGGFVVDPSSATAAD